MRLDNPRPIAEATRIMLAACSVVFAACSVACLLGVLSLGCGGSEAGGTEDCSNFVDDDGDALIDCRDSDCATAPLCAAGAADQTKGTEDTQPADRREREPEDDCGDEDKACCEGDRCGRGLECSERAKRCVRTEDDGECGGRDRPCCEERLVCEVGLECNRENETCERVAPDACGERGVRCCEEQPQCGDGLECDRESRRCVSEEGDDCGGRDQSCCDGSDSCSSGLECVSNRCRSEDADPCADNRDCSDCTAETRESCGWCDSSDTCMQGTRSGPSSGRCSDWDWDRDSCGGGSSSDPCAWYVLCEACTADGENDCGWCDSSRTCSQGTGDGPNVGRCTDWQWWDCGGGSSSGPDPCAIHTSGCGACTDDWDNLCGWCASTSSCMQGTAGGPDDGSCANWDWLASHCSSGDSCSSHEDCEDCIYDPDGGCGWCSTTGCMAGNEDEPDGGGCSVGTWSWWTCDDAW